MTSFYQSLTVNVKSKILFIMHMPPPKWCFVLRSNMGKAGREKFEKEFTLEVFEKSMTRILEHLVYPLFSKKSAIFCVFEYLYITLTRKYKPLILFRT